MFEIIDREEDLQAVDVQALTTAIRTATVAALVVDTGGDLWGEHPQYGKEDWQYEAMNGDTVLGYWEWVKCRLDEEEGES